MQYNKNCASTRKTQQLITELTEHALRMQLDNHHHFPVSESTNALPGVLCNLAAMYTKGYDSVLAPNPVQSFVLYLKSAQLGDPLSQYRVAKALMQNSEFIQKDPVYALYLLSNARKHLGGRDKSLAEFRMLVLMQIPNILDSLKEWMEETVKLRNFEICTVFSMNQALKKEMSMTNWTKTQTSFEKFKRHKLYDRQLVSEILKFCGDGCLPSTKADQADVGTAIKYALKSRLTPEETSASEIFSKTVARVEKHAEDGTFFRVFILICLAMTIVMMFFSRRMWSETPFTDWLQE